MNKSWQDGSDKTTGMKTIRLIVDIQHVAWHTMCHLYIHISVGRQEEMPVDMFDEIYRKDSSPSQTFGTTPRPRIKDEKAVAGILK
jgi:hypothetical protein